MADKDLPEGWIRAFSRSQQRDYFYHEASGKSVWRFEDLPKLPKLIEQENANNKRSRSLSGDSAKNRRDDSDNEKESSSEVDSQNENEAEASSLKQAGPKRRRSGEPRGRTVVIIVPFRDQHESQQRAKHLAKFVPHMEAFLGNNEEIWDFHILIVEQSDDGRKFNRGKLLNIGFKYATEELKAYEFDSFIFHDVDLLPQTPLKPWYAAFPDRPIHIACCWGRYNNNKNYFGGIVAFSASDFVSIDGFPNTYWGWGGEDDELAQRVNAAKLAIKAPPRDLEGAIVDLENLNLKNKLDVLRKTNWKCNVKWEARDEYKKYREQRHEIPWWGLTGVNYTLLETKALSQHATKITVDVQFNLNSDGSEHWANRKTDW
eukprot:CAMPEP_0184513824 /NCGR_PEP_ID=MMETSP0198_2-20121128/3629_1 /TAXON_ID=1112570 /ORGANISM="Thraustochytrium sp., Strain LLF1b" /LENGTH=373 /DNA_ID=CAMNT_0026903959 /DNA_START=266 /DNA_END=1384 /DNA_ORIENTATION=-